jgi:hypothetical protein
MPLSDLIVGTWTLSSSSDIAADGTRTETWGPNPLGCCMFDGKGNFTQMMMRSDLPQAASRQATTPEEARRIVLGSLAMYGTYTVDDAASTIDVAFTGSTFAAFNGTTGKRRVTMASPDEMRISNAGRAGGGRGESVWRRIS